MVNEKMTAIADKIRSLLGITGKMGLDAMATNLGTEQTDVENAFTAIGNKGGTVPSSKVSGNLATAINSIPAGVTVKRKTGKFTTRTNGTATVNVGFQPDLVFVTLNETTYGDGGGYNQSVTLLFDELPDTGYCNSLMWTNDNEGNATYLCDMWGKQTSNGFQFWFEWIHITDFEKYSEAYTFHYVAIKYT